MPRETFYDEIEIEDFTWDPLANVFHYPCPCGDRFEITKSQLRDGDEVARCPSCSLLVRVIYEWDDFEDYDSAEEEEAGQFRREAAGVEAGKEPAKAAPVVAAVDDKAVAGNTDAAGQAAFAPAQDLPDMLDKLKVNTRDTTDSPGQGRRDEDKDDAAAPRGSDAGKTTGLPRSPGLEAGKDRDGEPEAARKGVQRQGGGA